MIDLQGLTEAYILMVLVISSMSPSFWWVASPVLVSRLLELLAMVL